MSPSKSYPSLLRSAVFVFAFGTACDTTPCSAAFLRSWGATYDTALQQLQLNLAFDPVIDEDTPTGIDYLTIDVDGSFPFLGPSLTVSGATIGGTTFDGFPTDTVSVEFNPPLTATQSDLTLTFTDFDADLFAASGNYSIDLEVNRSDPSPAGEGTGANVYNDLIQALPKGPHPQRNIRAWAFEATVISLDDPKGLFGDVRLGDPVRGDFAYDLALEPSATTDAWSDYDHPPGFYGIRLSIENPRTDEELVYTPQTEFGYLVSVFTDHYLFPGDSAVDMWQDATPPLPGLSDLIYVDISGPAVLSESALPTEFNLDDWEFAAVYLGADNFFNGIVAQIHTLTPLATGDFDQSGTVDEADYDAWKRDFGSSAALLTDANRDGWVGAGDYTIWRDGRFAGMGANTLNVPEPASSSVALFAWGLVAVLMRQHFGRQRLSLCWLLLFGTLASIVCEVRDCCASSVPVSSAVVTAGNELVSFVAGSATYTQADLIQPMLTAFAGNPETPFGNILVPLSEPVPAAGSRRALLTDDFRLDSGIINPAMQPTAATLTFDEPLRNGPGPDLVMFELDTGDPPGNEFQVRINSTTQLFAKSSWGSTLVLLDIETYARDLSVPLNLTQLENDNHSLVRDYLDQNIVGTAIDLDDFGVAEDGSVSIVQFGGYNSDGDMSLSVDPVLFMGIRSPTELPGDYNADGVVGAADYTVWRDGLGTTYTHADYGVWRMNFGITSLVGSTNVPEPGSLLLAAAGSLAMLFCRRRASLCWITVAATALAGNMFGGTTHAAEFIPLSFLAEPPWPNTVQPGSRELLISDDGLIISGESPNPDGVAVLFRWTRETGLVALDDEAKSNSKTIMSADGSLIAWQVESGRHWRVWTEDEGTREYDFWFSTGLEESISSDGSVVVGSPFFGWPPESGQESLLRWTPESEFQSLGLPPMTDEPFTTYVSADGSVVIGTAISRNAGETSFTPFRWTAADGFTSLGTIPGASFYGINGVSADGSVVTGIFETDENSQKSLWRWTNETGLVVIAEGTPAKEFRQGNTRGVGDWLSADGAVMVGVLQSPDGTQREVYRWTEAAGLQIIPEIPGSVWAFVSDMTPDGKWLLGFSQMESKDLVPWIWSEETGPLDL